MQRGASGDTRCVLHLDLDCYYCEIPASYTPVCWYSVRLLLTAKAAV